jgi:hypothetical protein
VTVSELSEELIALQLEESQAYKLSDKHVDKQRANLTLVREILGDATLVRNINFDVCRQFCSTLARVP